LLNVSHLDSEMSAVVLSNAGAQLYTQPTFHRSKEHSMGEVHPIQFEPLAARDDGAAAQRAPVGAHREKRKRGHRVFLRSMLYGRAMDEVHRGASLLAAGGSAAAVAVMLVGDLIARR
jgi:hypothetical protein